MADASKETYFPYAGESFPTALLPEPKLVGAEGVWTKPMECGK